MKTNTNSKPPVWHGFANSMLEEITESRKPLLEPETEAQIAAEVAGLWAMTSAEAAVSPDEAEAMSAAGDDLLAADATSNASPDWPVDIPLMWMCARVAQTFGSPRAVADLTRPGAITVLQIADPADLSKMSDVVRNGLIPKRIRVAQTLTGTAREKIVHCISVFRGDSGDSTLKSAIARVEDALGLRPAVIVMLSDPTLLPKSLRDVLPAPIKIAPLSQETVLFALTKSHSRTGRIDRKSLLASLPSDQALSRLSKVELYSAFRESSTLRVAGALSRMCSVTISKDRLSELEGSGALYTVAQQIVGDIKAFAKGALTWSEVPHGLLLTGAPGTGKTYAAQCIADASGLPFVTATVGGWQSKGHLGDMLKAMIATFEEARLKAPCILFIDELDSIGDRKDADNHGKILPPPGRERTACTVGRGHRVRRGHAHRRDQPSRKHRRGGSACRPVGHACDRAIARRAGHRTHSAPSSRRRNLPRPDARRHRRQRANPVRHRGGDPVSARQSTGRRREACPQPHHQYRFPC